MSKIIEPGNMLYECNCCGCKFEIEAEDIQYETATSLFRQNGYYYAKCPQCSSKVRVNYKK